MERTRNVETPPVPAPDGKIWWRNDGGTFRMNGKIIKPKQRFKAAPGEISKAFRNVITPLEEIAAETNTPVPIEVVKTEYELKPRGNSKSLFDVVYPVGKDDEGETIWKAINEKALPKAMAEKLMHDLSKG